MRPISKKRQKRNRAVKPFRDELIRRVGKCEHCGSTWNLCVHEIARGIHREKALDKPYAVLVLCWDCNSGPFNDKGEWPESRQLALLATRRPEDYSLIEYLELTNPNAPRRIEPHEVMQWN